jgi:hypothetical protein
MEDISDRIDHLTQELRALHSQLQWPNFHNASPSEQELILNQVLNAGLGHDLKKAVDLLSQFLWCYIESAAARSNDETVDYSQQSARLGQATAMLRLLHHSACPLMDSLTFVEHATMTVTRQMETPTNRKVLAMEKTA